MKYVVEPLAIDGLYVMKAPRHHDQRGWFMELWMESARDDLHLHRAFQQDNVSLSLKRNTLRGLHGQAAPFNQTKAVTVLTGEIFDVVVDTRRRSPSYGQVSTRQMHAALGETLIIPAGCLHGFLTLRDETLLLYKLDAPYSPKSEIGVRWDDPDLAIDWPLDGAPILSDRDAALPRLSEVLAGETTLSDSVRSLGLGKLRADQTSGPPAARKGLAG